MSKSLSLLFYNLLLPIGLLFMVPGALRKMRRRGGRWQDLGQRFGNLPTAKRAALAALPPQTRLWMHAVSVGEVGIATKLIQRLLKEKPGVGIVLTTTTPTGHALAQEFAERQGGQVAVLYSPVDLPWVAETFLDLIRPRQIILVEAEVWPNLISRARREGIPTRIVNARLSTRSERRFRRFGALIRPVFAQLDQVLVQDEADIARFAALGVEPSRIRRTGSIKFDPQGGAVDEAQVGQFRSILATAGIPPSRPTLLLASTHPGEEALLAAAYLKVRQSHPEVALLVVPRHVERTAEVVSDLQKLGLQPQRRSQVTGPTECLIIDTTGELRAWQFLATIVIVGKSFLSTGGQNPAEAVMAKKPVIFGPHMENFESLVDLLRAHAGAIQVPDTETLIREVESLLTNPARRDKLGAAGFAALQAHEGATAQTIRLLLPG